MWPSNMTVILLVNKYLKKGVRDHVESVLKYVTAVKLPETIIKGRIDGENELVVSYMSLVVSREPLVNSWSELE